jgi:DNA polymerase-3 subunit gamma/tau
MAYEVTATRKRPQTFDEMVGQDFVVATLKNSIAQGRIAHAYLFSGPRGVGKTSAARILAKALNCEKGTTGTPCGECGACREITQGNSLDVLEIDGASNTGVNDVRQIKDEVLFAPNSGRYKIYIIDEVHMLSNSAFNALLKTIEEPPPYIVFVFATTEVHKVPATIRSRCQQFNFRLIGPEQIKQRLQQVVQELNIPAEEAALFWMAREATGSLRDAYTLLDQVISFSTEGIRLEAIREKLGLVGIEGINRLGTFIAQGDKKQLLEAAAELLESGVAVEQLAEDLLDYFRNLLLIKSGIRRESLLSFAVQEFSPEVVGYFSAPQLEKALELLLELHRGLKFSASPRFDLELLLCRLAGLGELIPVSELVQSLKSLKAAVLVESGATVGDAAPPGTGGGRGPEPAAVAGAVSAAGQAAAAPVAARAAAPGTASAAGGESVGAAAGTAASTGAAATAPAAAAPAAPAAHPDVLPAGGLKALSDAVRREKLALAASLEKAEAWSLERGELRLVYRPKDRYPGVQVSRDREVVLRHAAEVFAGQPVTRLRVDYSGEDPAGSAARNDQAEMVKKIFRGEVVKGE